MPYADSNLTKQIVKHLDSCRARGRFSRPASRLIPVLFMAFALSACSGEMRPNPSVQSDFSSVEIPNEPEARQKYIVILKPELKKSSLQAQAAAVKERVQALSADQNLPEPEHVFTHALQGAVYDLTYSEVENLKNDPKVAYVETDQIAKKSSTQANPVWSLDRLDQDSVIPNNSYNHDDTGNPVDVYVIDTGIRTTHQEFEGRAKHGYDFVDGDSNASDCDGHGTHVAGVIGGKTYGVFKKANLIGVRVLDCEGSGYYSDVIAGVDWVTAHHRGAAVANLSLGGDPSQALDDAIQNSIRSGVVYTVAGGNDSDDACNYSPSRLADAISVGAVDRTDTRSWFSDYGRCIDLYAAGSEITSSWADSDVATMELNGSSMASPLVAGIAAMYISKHPQASPAEVANAILGGALRGKVKDPGTNSNNLLANTLFLNQSSPPVVPVPTTTTVIKNGVAQKNLKGSANESQYYVLTVPIDLAQVSFTLSGGTGDANIYVRYGKRPTESSYDCASTLKKGVDKCIFEINKRGKVFVLVKGVYDYSGFSLLGRYTSNDPSPCGACLNSRGEILKVGQTDTYNFVAKRAGPVNFWIKQPQGANFKVQVETYKKGWITAQNINFLSQASYRIVNKGAFRIKVTGVKGKGVYSLWVKSP